MPTTVSLIAERLKAAGCQHAFGIPGGEVLEIMRALQEAGIDFHLCKHENAGGFMAEGAHHATGAPGILLATIGPGLANGLNSVVNALQDQVPLIVISGCVDGAEAATYTHQIFDQAALMKPITKATFTVPDGAVDVVIDKAVSIALADPPGPVHIDIPVSIATKEQPAARRAPSPAEAPMAPAPSPAFEAAREMLAKAARPVMVAGMGVLHHGAVDEVRETCERFGMPLITTYKAKGVLPEDHPLAMGGHGLSPLADTLVMPFLEQADFILTVGYDPIEMRTGWRDPWDPAKVVELNHLPSRHGMHGAALSFVGHVGKSLAALTAGIEPRQALWTGGEPAALQAKLRETFGPREAWGAHAAFAAARRAAPADTVFTADSGAHRILLSEMPLCPAPKTLLQSSALCTMGVAVPLAMGFKLANPGKPVVAVVGDAGMEMTLGELATLRDWKLPLAIMVMVDESLALIELKQRRSGLENLGVDFPGTDFPAVAQALGGHGVWVKDDATLEAELTAAFSRDSFTLLACAIGRKAYDGAF